MQTNRKSPTTDEVLARQVADHAPKPVQPRPRPAPPATGNSGKAVVARPPAPPTQSATPGLPAVPDARTSVAQYLGEHTSQSMVSGDIIKLSKEGKMINHATGDEIDPNAEFVALMREVAVTWSEFPKDEPPIHVGGLLYEGYVLPPRESLGNLDKSKWPLGLSGMPEDPVKNQIYLPLQNVDTKELVTFITGSRTGRNAVGSLLRHYERMRKAHPDELPVVRLRTGGFNHKDERIGWVTTPAFVVVGRTPADSAARPDTSLATDMNDEIPDFD
jgi:hypothetical protein